MSATKRWNVWSVQRKDCSGLVVVEGISEKEARDAADRKNAAAARHDMPMLAFVALPQGQNPTWEDLPPLPEPPAARNTQPLHHHEAELRRRKALDDEPEPEPGHRYTRIYWGKLRTSDDPGDRDLYLESSNGTSIVCFSPGDMPALRAAVLPESEGLRALQDIWSANLGPGGRGAVEAGHAAGYRLGVEDMEHVHSELTDAAADFLVSLYETAGNEADRKAIDRVRDLLEKLRAAHG